MLEFIRENQALSGWIAAASLLMFVGGLIVMPILVARMRSDYFLGRKPPPESWSGRHRVTRIAIVVVKNVVGVILLLLGIAMLVLPGQGIITILVGISLLNFPGKRRLELKIIRQPPVLQAVNWIRSKAGKLPLRLPSRGD
jgi:MFS family permease